MGVTDWLTSLWNPPKAQASAPGASPSPGYAPTPENVAALKSGSVQGASTTQNSSQPKTGIFDQYGNQIGSSQTTRVTTTTPSTQPTAQPKPTVDNSRLAELQRQKNSGQLGGSAEMEYNELIRQSQGDQQKSAEDAAEARRRAAEAKYNAQKGIAETAKVSAKQEYDWLVDTLGSNKKDALEQLALNRSQGEADYATQEEKTRKDYDAAKQNILSTYRDLQVQQEKILRGSGMGTSSRSQEAALKLNNLMGKDLSTISTNEADSLAVIGNALTYFQKQVALTSNTIETESKSKLDKAAIDYDKQIKSIDANLSLSAAEKEEAYANAEIQLAQDSQAISQWAAGLKLQAAEMQAKTQESMDSLIADMLDVNGTLNSTLDQKRAAAAETASRYGVDLLTKNPTTTDPGVGVYQDSASYSSKDALDKAMQDGKLSPQEYQTQLQRIQMQSSPVGGTATAKTTTLASANPRGMTTTQQDPLLAALFARA